MLFVTLLLLLAVGTAPASVIFEDCGSAYQLQVVNIEGCGMRLPCFVTLGDAVPVSVRFNAGFSSSQLDQDVVININLVNLNTEVTPEPCEIVNCPVATNAPTSFTSVMLVPTRMALNQRGYLRWRVFNENGRLVLCYSVLVQTQSALQKLLRGTLPDDVVNSIDSDHVPTATLNDEKIPNQQYIQGIIEQYYRDRSYNASDGH